MSIKGAVDSISNEIEKLQNEIKEIQSACKHPNKKVEYAPGMGVYNPREDLYYTNYYCPDCKKEWMSSQ